jgi:hypothetical protein
MQAGLALLIALQNKIDGLVHRGPLGAADALIKSS